MARLLRLSPKGPPIPIVGVTALGRAELGGDGVSERHLVIDASGSRVVVEDCGSTNGTRAGGVRLRRGERRVVVDGTELRVGAVRLLVRLDGPALASIAASVDTAALAKAALLQGEGPVVVVAHQGLPARSLLLADGQTATVGRAGDLPIAEDTVSERHAEVRRSGAQVFVRDVGSRHGTCLADAPLPPHAWHPWPVGVAVTLGRAVLVVEGLDVPEMLEAPEILPVRAPSLPEVPAAPPGVFVQTPPSASLDPDAPTATRPKVPLEGRRSGPLAGLVVGALLALLAAALVVGLLFAR